MLSNIIKTALDATGSANISKAIGALVGGMFGRAVSDWGLPADFADPVIVEGVKMILTGLFAAATGYAFPANRPG